MELNIRSAPSGRSFTAAGISSRPLFLFSERGQGVKLHARLNRAVPSMRTYANFMDWAEPWCLRVGEKLEHFSFSLVLLGWLTAKLLRRA